MKVKQAAIGQLCGEEKCPRPAVIVLESEVGGVSLREFPLCKEHWQQVKDATEGLLRS